MPDSALLARRYRRLLVAYPRAYRKARGAEIVDTLLDAAPPDRTRPTPREAVDLAAAGLRARLGRPGSRLVVWCSILTAVTAGLLGSVVGYRIAWQQAAGPLPTAAEARGMATTAAPGRVLGGTERDGYVFGWAGQERHRSLAGELVRWPLAADLPGMEDPDLYGPGNVGLQTVRRTPASYATAARQAAARLRAHGWEVDCAPGQGVGPCQQTRTGTQPSAFLVARKGGAVLEVSFERGSVAEPDPNSDAIGADTPTWMPSARGPMLAANAWVYRTAATSPLIPIAQLAAGLLAAAVAWLAFGWLSRRTEGRRGAAVAYGILTVAMLPSAVSAARTIGYTLVTGTPEPGDGGPWLPSAAPIHAILDFGALLDLVALPALLVLLALALLPRRKVADPVAA